MSIENPYKFTKKLCRFTIIKPVRANIENLLKKELFQLLKKAYHQICSLSRIMSWTSGLL